MEFIKQVEVNIDYILMLVAKYHDSNCKDKEILFSIDKAINLSLALHSKKELINNFVHKMNADIDVMNDWHKFVKEQEKIDLKDLIKDENLNKWLEKNDYLKDVYPYDKILLEVIKVLEDGVLTNEESDYLLDGFKEILNPKLDNNKDIDFNGKTFCLTGEFESESKAEVSKRIQALGGIEKKGVSSKLNYLIVGAVGSEAWKFGNIGGKQAKAQELNEKCANIIIISENILNKYK